MIKEEFKTVWRILSNVLVVVLLVFLILMYFNNKEIGELNKDLKTRNNNQADLIIKMTILTEAYNELIPEHEALIREYQDYRDNAEKIIALNPLKEFYSDNLISEMVKDIPTGYIFRSGFVPTAFFGDSIGMHGFYRTDHKGIDGYGKGGDTYITPVAEGKVTKTGEDLIYGKYVYVQHSRFVRTFYAHGKTIFNRARVGQIVGSDDVIMEMGETGLADGIHVHAEVQVCVDEVNDIWIAVDFFPFFTKGINE
ncbi:MAG: M23 family metallopeptidase [Alphaproteobacteria bacterium]|nr:M23 family metallopeptidase [Alphaproteobacteria bacterium]